MKINKENLNFRKRKKKTPTTTATPANSNNHRFELTMNCTTARYSAWINEINLLYPLGETKIQKLSNIREN